MGKRRDDLTVSIPLSSSSSSCPSSSSSTSPSIIESEPEELKPAVPLDPPRMKAKKRLSKQLSVVCETPLDMAWEKRRRQMMLLKERKQKQMENGEQTDLTDEDLRELKGCIELGFGFNEEEGQKLCNTLPALDLYFAVNRQLSPVPSPGQGGGSGCGGPSSSSSSASGPPSSLESPMSESDSLKILSPGANPQQVKTRLRHWAQAVACSVMQSS